MIVPVTDIKCVKNSFIIRDTSKDVDYVKVFHYNSEILNLDLVKRQVIKSYTPSRTSSKMANRVKAYYDIF